MRVTVFALVSLFFGLGSTAGAFAQRDVVFSACNFQLRDSHKQANLSFNLAYKIVIDGEGHPYKISRILGKESYVSDEAAKACITDWRFKGYSEGMSFMALFRW